ncbi:uncharacterized protein [Periplaneta americana]|uniref:uncharacterized protein isoform X4 n=1 Tax=Periplaneta americana TaxID=6978 RepID=UPI0037E89ED6
MTESEVPRLHPEVLEVVFSHLDGKSLARCEQVCKLWNELVQRISQRTDIWKRCCEKEIDRGTRLEVLDKSFPSWHLSCLSEAEWREVYKNWCQWQHLDSWGYKTRTICEDTHIAPVTCMRTSGTSVVTGHHYGDVFLWGDDDVVNVTLHVRHVTDLSLMVYGGLSKNDSEQLHHDLVISTSLDHTVQINPLTFEEDTHGFPIVIKEHFGPTIIVRSFRNLFAVLSYDERVSVWQVTNSSGNIRAPEISKLHTLRIHSDPFAAISIWGAGSIQVRARKTSLWMGKLSPEAVRSSYRRSGVLPGRARTTSGLAIVSIALVSTSTLHGWSNSNSNRTSRGDGDDGADVALLASAPSLSYCSQIGRNISVSAQVHCRTSRWAPVAQVTSVGSLDVGHLSLLPVVRLVAVPP